MVSQNLNKNTHYQKMRMKCRWKSLFTFARAQIRLALDHKIQLVRIDLASILIFLLSCQLQIVLADKTLYLEKGIQAAEKGDFQAAINQFRRAIQRDPQNTSAYFYLSRAYQEIGDLEFALTACQQVISLRPDLADGHNDLGQILHRQGQFQKAIKAYQHAIKLGPKSAHFHYNLGTAYHTLGQFSKAKTIYQTALNLDQQFTPARYNLGAIYQKQGRVNEAIETYEQVLNEVPDHTDAHQSLTFAATEKQKLFGQLILKYQTAIAIQPDEANNYRKLGLAYYHTGQWLQAIQTLKIALQVDPDSEQRWADLGKVQSQLDRHVEHQLQRYNRASQTTETATRIGQIHLASGQLASAEIYFRRALKLAPTYPTIQANLAEVLYKQNKWDEAKKIFQQIIRYYPKHGNAHKYLGLIAHQQKLPHQALKHLEVANNLNPNDPTTCYYLGLAANRASNVTRALAAYQLASRLKPDLVDVYASLGDIYLQLGKTNASLMFYKKFINMAQYQPDLEHKLDRIKAKTVELTNETERLKSQ